MGSSERSALKSCLMFSMALRARKAGFHVQRYGSGALRLRVTRERLEELAQFKQEHWFMYPDISSLMMRHEL